MYFPPGTEELCMKRLLLLTLLVSCSHLEQKLERPSWVSGVRFGEEASRVDGGKKVFYRRIGGSARLSREISCIQAQGFAEADLKKEHPYQDSIPFKTEVVFYDEEYRDCAVTISVDKKYLSEALSRRRDIASLEGLTEDDAVEILKARTAKAERFALTGLTRPEFEKFTEDKVVLLQGQDLCQRGLATQTFSIHGSMHVCWQGNHILGYCTLRDQQCWTKTP